MFFTLSVLFFARTALVVHKCGWLVEVLRTEVRDDLCVFDAKPDVKSVFLDSNRDMISQRGKRIASRI